MNEILYELLTGRKRIRLPGRDVQGSCVAVEVQSRNRWTPREVPVRAFLCVSSSSRSWDENQINRISTQTAPSISAVFNHFSSCYDGINII